MSDRKQPKRVRFHFSDPEQNLTEEEVQDIERRFPQSPQYPIRPAGSR